ncbi:MAG: hypothetical protein LQ351_000789 [Letrouitia transgressa]|nr:MAG: hypothetical protein LQ351_000789 [Letrouitia transgressa]
MDKDGTNNEFQRIHNHDEDAQPPFMISKAGSLDDVERALTYLNTREASTAGRLEHLLAARKEMHRELGRLDLLRATIGSQAVSTRNISNTVLSDAAVTATRIATAVNKLDTEQARVKATLVIVEQVSELKACVLGVAGSMGAPQDWETAAAYLNRASKIPAEIVNGSFAEENVPTADVPDPPRVTLSNASESLQGLFIREFGRAAQDGNSAKVTRFFKLFPLIGKPEVGLDVYGRYVCQGVAIRARENLNAGTGGAQTKDTLFYANALTKLFEHIAQIVEHHGALVELHYGAGHMIKVIERLQLEADIQGGIILDTWSDDRAIDRKTTDIKSYAFTFLVQSFLPSQPARSGTPRAGSPAAKGSSVEIKNPGDEGVEIKTIAELLNEITLMLARWSLYSKFLASKCRDPMKLPLGDTVGLKMPSVLANSNLKRKINERLIIPVNLITTFLLRRSIERAFQLHEQPQGLSLNPSKTLPSDPPYISSVVDDVMYIVNQVVERSLSTSQRAVVASVIPSVSRVLDSDFVGMVQRKMRDEYYPKAAVQGSLPPERTIIAFLVLINDLDIATDYVSRIVQSRVEDKARGEPSNEDSTISNALSLTTLYPFDEDASFVIETLNSMQKNFAGKTAELIADGIYVVFKNVVKPRLRPVITEAFRDVDYQANDENVDLSNGAMETERNDPLRVDSAVHHSFQRGWDALTRPIARLLTGTNFERLLWTIVSYLSEVLEKRIWSYYGRINEVGSARLERDIANIVNVVVRGRPYGLRNAFIRCTQICLVMNMEQDEWEELQNVHDESETIGADWKIDKSERDRARALIHGS